MRNLSVLSHRAITFASGSPLKIKATAADLDNGSIYAVATSRISPTAADVTIHFLKVSGQEQAFTQFNSLLVPGPPSPLPNSSTAVASTSGRSPTDVIDFHYLSDGGQEVQNQAALCTISAGGDLLLLPVSSANETLDDAPAIEPSVVGTIEQGIGAACWSPDDELLVLVTSEMPQDASSTGRSEAEKVLLMTRDFEVLSELSLRTDSFGEDEAVDVGWGSKATQFHGSEGKAAAAAAAEAAAAAKESKTDTRGPKLPDDDGRPRISWRGDGAFFAISSLEPFIPSSSDSATDLIWHRIIRIYSRTGALSATSDASVRGISHTLAFRPIGNLIASTQRFGPSDVQGQMWSQGRKGRHDVVFFERNGLRHGEFSLREESASQPQGTQLGWIDSQNEAPWSRTHFVRELAWNADGSALAVWLTRAGEANSAHDVVQIYTTGNYHWYLKQEFVTSVMQGVEQVNWHPEDPLQLLIAHTDRVEQRYFTLETMASGGRPPVDVACVAVADGAATLLTPFRMQNVPPPMASLSLLLPPADPSMRASAAAAVTVPCHTAWSQLPGRSLDEAIGIMAAVFQNGFIQIWRFDWGLLGSHNKVRGSPAAEPKLIAAVQLNNMQSTASAAYQIAVAGWAAPSLENQEANKVSIAVLSSAPQGAKIDLLELSQAQDAEVLSVYAQRSVTVSGHGKKRIVADPFVPVSTTSPSFYLENEDGEVHTVDKGEWHLVTKLERFCSDFRILASGRAGQQSKIIGLASNGRLLAEKQVIAKDATSFTLVGSFLVWTNTSHEARFLPLTSLGWTAAEGGRDASGSEAVDLGRRVERGSRIVTAVPSAMSLILQMPRGNLETIYPRPLVLEVVRRNIDAQRYGPAFRICRTHRMDVNILYDHDPEAFMRNVATFVRQVADVDYLNLFLSGLRDEDVTRTLYKPLSSQTSASDPSPLSATATATTQSKVNKVCDAIRVELEALDSRKYVQSILTTYVRKVPADYEAGLSLLLRLKESDPETAEEAVKYIIFLADADKLFDVALGMYDYTLTLMIAQHAKRKDPREYLPFLRELRSLSPVEYQRFRIDDHLGRHVKALSWLVKAGVAHHKDALRYADKHRLYHEAIELYAADGASRLRDAYELFGEYLLTRRKFDDAGAAFQLAGKNRKALEAYRESTNWTQAIRLAFVEKLAPAEIVAMAKSFVDELESSRQFTQAARICLDYIRDVEQAVSLLCRGGEFSEARRILTTYSRHDLNQVTLHPLLIEAASTLIDDIGEMSEQLHKQLGRIRELREKRALALAQGAHFYADENDAALDNLDVQSDTSTQMTQFTRYTRAASIASQQSSLATFSTKSGSRKKQAKLNKKQERAKAGGKKGSIFEQDYLYTSVQKLLKDRLGAVQLEAAKLLPHLLCAGPAPIRARANEVSTSLSHFETQASQAVNTLWAYSQQDDDERFDMLVKFEHDILDGKLAENAIMATMSFRAIANLRVPRSKLEVAENKWRSVLLDRDASTR